MSLARRFVVFFVMFALALQCYITQTHIHGAPPGSPTSISAPQAPAPGKAPVDNNAVNCAFCQAVAHAGVFLGSAALFAHAPFVWVTAIALLMMQRGASVSASYDWRSRAPPRA